MLWRDETAAVVAFLGPRIGIEKEGAGDAFGGQHIKHIAGITGVNRNILCAGVADFAQEHGDAIDIRLAPYKADIRVLHGLMHHVFAATKPDFKPDVSIPEKSIQIN